jgi:methanogenic corrinoid protein MtbC1
MADPTPQSFIDQVKKQNDVAALLAAAMTGLIAQHKATADALAAAETRIDALTQDNTLLHSQATKTAADLADANARFVATASDLQQVLAQQAAVAANTAQMQTIIDGLRGPQPA